MGGYLGDSGAKELKMVPVPSDDPDNLGLFLKPAMLMVASAKTKNKDAARKFIDFMVNSPEVGEIFKTSRGVPASKKQREATTFDGVDAQVVAYEESIAKYLSDAPEPPIVGFGTLESEFKRIRQELNYGKVTVDQAVDAVVQVRRRRHQAKRLADESPMTLTQTSSPRPGGRSSALRCRTEKSKRRRAEARAGYTFLLPWLLGFIRPDGRAHDLLAVPLLHQLQPLRSAQVDRCSITTRTSSRTSASCSPSR